MSGLVPRKQWRMAAGENQVSEISTHDPFWASPFVLRLDQEKPGAALPRVIAVFRLIVPRITFSTGEPSAQAIDRLEVLCGAGDASALRRESDELWHTGTRGPVQTSLSRLFAACAFLIQGDPASYRRELSRSLFVLCSSPGFQQEWTEEVVKQLTL
jgi:hypothetical protein